MLPWCRPSRSSARRSHRLRAITRRAAARPTTPYPGSWCGAGRVLCFRRHRPTCFSRGHRWLSSCAGETRRVLLDRCRLRPRGERAVIRSNWAFSGCHRDDPGICHLRGLRDVYLLSSTARPRPAAWPTGRLARPDLRSIIGSDVSPGASGAQVYLTVRPEPRPARECHDLTAPSAPQFSPSAARPPGGPSRRCTVPQWTGTCARAQTLSDVERGVLIDVIPRSRACRAIGNTRPGERPPIEASCRRVVAAPDLRAHRDSPCDVAP